MSQDLGKRVLDALVRSVDTRALGEALKDLGPAAKASPPTATGGDETARAVLKKIVLSDLLDDSILGARPGDIELPLRMFFGTLGDELGDETAFALANGSTSTSALRWTRRRSLSVALEVSRLYYKLAEDLLDAELVRPLSPPRAVDEAPSSSRSGSRAVDGARVFDSWRSTSARSARSVEREDRGSKSFLCRVVANDRVRVKATVRT
ncbi:MAG: hypothetical protein R3B82_10440 [Sandaracinaceae bacterium]